MKNRTSTFPFTLAVVTALALCAGTTCSIAGAQTVSTPTVSARIPFLPSGAADVLKMYQAGVGQDVLVGYINSSSLSFHLSADGIVYLQSLGVPQDLTQAMLQRDNQLQQQQAQQQYQQQQYQQQLNQQQLSDQSPAQVVAPPAPEYVAPDYPYYDYGYDYPYYGYGGIYSGWPVIVGNGYVGGYGGFYRGGGFHGGGGFRGGVGGFHGGVGGGGHGGGVHGGGGGFHGAGGGSHGGGGHR